MPRVSCWWPSSAAVVPLFLLLLAAGFAAGDPADAATVLEKRISVTVGDGGEVRERTVLEVLLDAPGDADAWSSYAVFLDDNRRLDDFDARVVTADGRRLKVKRRHQDKVEYSGKWITYASHHFHVADLPGLEVGARIEIEHVVEIEPYFPADQMALLGDDPIARLEVTVRGGGSGGKLRWRLDGPASGLETTELADGVRITGSDLPAVDPPELAAGGSAVAPVLRYSWSGDGGWEGVGRWYQGLLGSVADDGGAVEALAAELTAGAETPRERLEALLAHLRRKVRYEAVEIGIGGYRPSPPAEVIERSWGDCKDKALLLVELLGAVGIDAHPALILLGSDRQIDVELPSPIQFNHAIVAVPADQVATEPEDPVAEGFLFLDPTQERGTARWLHPGVQGQDALVVLPGGGTLVRTPVRPEHERSFLVTDLQVTTAGDAAGRAGLLLTGRLGAGWLDRIEAAAPQEIAGRVRSLFGNLLPGARLGEPGWTEEPGEVPAVRLVIEVELPRLIDGVGARPSFRLPSLSATPEPRLLEELGDLPAAVTARRVDTLWRLTLPEGWCRPEPKTRGVETAVGTFEQLVGTDDEGRAVLRRTTELRRRLVDPDEHPELEKLALAERRAERRRVRLRCEE